MLVFFPEAYLTGPFSADFVEECASLPKRLEARPCSVDQDSHNPVDDGNPFGQTGALGERLSRFPYRPDLASVSVGCCFEEVEAGIGERPLEGYLERDCGANNEDDVLASTLSLSFSSLNEISLRFRGRMEDSPVVEVWRKPLLMPVFIVAAGANGLGLNEWALGEMNETSTLALL